MKTNFKGRFLATAGFVIAAHLVYAPVAMAQSADQAKPEAAAEDEPTPAEITVTGSRIAKAGFEAPTPTTVVDQNALNASPQPNIAANLNQLPALAGSVTPRTAGNGVGGGAQGANFLNLRALGANRTLVLLDRKRVVAAATTGSVDLNLMPSSLIKRVDVVTGGASAAWGSDAVAGVVNLVLDNKFTGLKGSVQTGITTYGDGAEVRAEIAGGTSFAEGRGHIIASASYSKQDSIDRVDSRPWFKGTKLFNNPAFVAGNGQPKLIVADSIYASTGTYGGLIASGPLRGTQFLATGPAPFDFGTVGSNVSLVNGSYAGSQLGRGGTVNQLSEIDQIVTSGEQRSAFGRVSFDVTESINVYGEFIYGKSVADSLSVPYLSMAPNSGPMTIQKDNAYLPAATFAAMTTANVTSFQLSRANTDFGLAAPHNERSLYRYMVGADFQLGGGWSGQAYYEHGLSKVLNAVNNDTILFNWNNAVDAVRNGAGTIVCRANLTTVTAPGCVPINVFGPQTPTDAQRAYVIGVASQDIRLTEDVVALNLNGDLFSLPAGAVTLAVGAEYRRENHSATADAISLQDRTNPAVAGTGNWWVGNYKPSTGGYNVKEAYGEILVPIFKDSTLGRSLDFNGAARVTDYSTSGTVTTWKAGLTYDIAGGFKLRGVISRDIRAPNLNDYFLGGTANSVSVLDGANAVGVLRIQSGNAKLTPEIATTKTLGAVFQPEFLPGFSISADYFDIKIANAIGNLTPQQIVDRCRAGNTALCSFLVRNGAGVLTTIYVQPVNFRTEAMSGVDLEASYRFALGSGNVTIRSLWTYTGTHYLIDNGVKDSLLGEVAQLNGGPVKLRGLNSVTYDSDKFNVSLRQRYIGKAVLDAAWTSADVDNNTVSPVSYFDMSATAKVNAGNTKFEVFASVDNLFNAAPPRAPQTGGNPNTNIGTAATFYDLVGRSFRAGVRVKM